LRLNKLFEMELAFEKSWLNREPEDSGYNFASGYFIGKGTVSGNLLHGKVHWTLRSRGRGDGTGPSDQNTSTWVPHVDGAIELDDGSLILMSLAGYNRHYGIVGDRYVRSITMRGFFQSAADRYRWINRSFTVIVGSGSWSVAPKPIDITDENTEDEVWKLSVFVCENDFESSDLEAEPAASSITHLEPLLSGEIFFAKDLGVEFPSVGTNDNIVSYRTGTGSLNGAHINGKISSCTLVSRSRKDGLRLPKISGIIRMNGSELVSFTFRGYEEPSSLSARQVSGDSIVGSDDISREG